MCVCVQKCNEGIDGLDALWLKLDHVRSSYNESNVQSHHERPLPGGKIHHISRSGEKGVGIELKEKKEKYEAELKKELKKMQRFRVRRRHRHSSSPSTVLPLCVIAEGNCRCAPMMMS